MKKLEIFINKLSLIIVTMEHKDMYQLLVEAVMTGGASDIEAVTVEGNIVRYGLAPRTSPTPSGPILGGSIYTSSGDYIPFKIMPDGMDLKSSTANINMGGLVQAMEFQARKTLNYTQ